MNNIRSIIAEVLGAPRSMTEEELEEIRSMSDEQVEDLAKTERLTLVKKKNDNGYYGVYNDTRRGLTNPWLARVWRNRKNVDL